MKTTNPPEWAIEFIRKVYTFMQYNGFPVVTWANSASGGSGRAWASLNKIHITADTGDRARTKRVILHEIAHLRNPGVNHGPAFYDTCWTLYKKFGMDIEKCLEEESEYKAESVRSAVRMKVITAKRGKEILSARREEAKGAWNQKVEWVLNDNRYSEHTRRAVMAYRTACNTVGRAKVHREGIPNELGGDRGFKGFNAIADVPLELLGRKDWNYWQYARKLYLDGLQARFELNSKTNEIKEKATA